MYSLVLLVVLSLVIGLVSGHSDVVILYAIYTFYSLTAISLRIDLHIRGLRTTKE